MKNLRRTTARDLNDYHVRHRCQRTEMQTRREISRYLSLASTRRCAASIAELRPRFGASA